MRRRRPRRIPDCVLEPPCEFPPARSTSSAARSCYRPASSRLVACRCPVRTQSDPSQSRRYTVTTPPFPAIEVLHARSRASRSRRPESYRFAGNGWRDPVLVLCVVGFVRAAAAFRDQQPGNVVAIDVVVVEDGQPPADWYPSEGRDWELVCPSGGVGSLCRYRVRSPSGGGVGLSARALALGVGDDVGVSVGEAVGAGVGRWRRHRRLRRRRWRRRPRWGCRSGSMMAQRRRPRRRERRRRQSGSRPVSAWETRSAA